MIIQNDTFWSMSSTNRNISSTDAGFRQKRRSTCQGRCKMKGFFNHLQMRKCLLALLLLALLLLCCYTKVPHWRIIWASKSSCTWWVLMRRRASQLMSQSWLSTASKQQIFVFVVLFEQWWPYSHLIIVQIVVQNAQLIWGKSLNSGKYCALWTQNFTNYHLIAENNGWNKHCLEMRWE